MSSRYKHLHDHHLKWHNLKKGLLKWTYDEDAKTVRRALRRVPSHRLKRRLARALLKDG
jgi:hypothetical protein